MLVLTRKKGEIIQIGNDIEITITNIIGDQVKIGISAPKKYRNSPKRNLFRNSGRKCQCIKKYLSFNRSPSKCKKRLIFFSRTIKPLQIPSI